MGSNISTFGKSNKYNNLVKVQDLDQESKKAKILTKTNGSFSAAFGSGISYCNEKVLKKLNLEAAPTKIKYYRGMKCIGEIKLTMKLENSYFLHTFVVVIDSSVDFFVGNDFLKNFENITFLSEDKKMILAKMQSSTVFEKRCCPGCQHEF